MAVAYIKYDPLTSTHGKFVQATVDSLRNSRRLTSYLQTFATMIDGDPSDVNNYTTLKNALKTDTNDDAKRLYDELQSLNFKLTTDASQDHVNAAIEQAIAKLLV